MSEPQFLLAFLVYIADFGFSARKHIFLGCLSPKFGSRHQLCVKTPPSCLLSGEAFLLTVGAFWLTVVNQLLRLQAIEVLVRRTFSLYRENSCLISYQLPLRIETLPSK